MKLQNIVLLFAIVSIIFYSQAQARQYEPGKFRGTSYTGDRSGALKTDYIYRGWANDEIKFTDVETNAIVYSVIYDNRDRYPQDIFSPDGKTLRLLWLKQSPYPGQISKNIELIDIYNKRLIKRYDVKYEENWSVEFSLCSNFAYVTIYSSNAAHDKWDISYEFIDLKNTSNTVIKAGSVSSKCAPPDAYINQDAKTSRLWTCDAGDVATFSLPSPASYIPNDPDPVMPPVTVIPEGIIDGTAASAAFKGLTALAKAILSKIIQPSDFPTIKYAARVIGPDKKPIFGLTSGNFQVKEDNVIQSPITVVAEGNETPVSIALCLDTSGSIGNSELAQINSTANSFIDLFGSNDRGAIYKFSTNVSLAQGFASDKTALKNAINATPSERSLTSLYDAIYDAINLSKQEINHKVVVALTDGYDNDSTHTLQQITDLSLENKIPVFTIGLGNPLNVSLLQSIANSCGGVYFNSPTTDKLAEVFNKVAENVRSRYLITYTTNNPNKDGTTRTVETTATSGGNSASATFQYRAPQGIKPAAQIVSISPNPASVGDEVTFRGMGVGGTIIEYSWRSSIDNAIGNQETFTTRILSEGQHTIYFKVKNNDGLWSDEVSSTLTVSSTRTITGIVQYENRPYNETGSGSDTIELKPVRFADFEIVKASDQAAVLASGETNSDGTYNVTFKANNNETIILKCYAYQENVNYNIKVVDSQGNKHSAKSPDMPVTDFNLTLNLNITEANNAGAFNVLDTIMQGSDKVKELSNSVPQLITVKWQKGFALGAYYQNNTISLNGSSDDPDEYDDAVILHEYGHFIMDKYSYGKSPGGDHQANDTNQDIRLSWSEGWATYFLSLVRDSSLYIDTRLPITNTFFYNIENLQDSRWGSLSNYAQGQDTEVSVSSILWDIYDSTNDTGDTLSLGAQPIWNVFVTFRPYLDCVLEDFFSGFFSNSANEAYRRQVNNIFAERKVFYSTPLFKRGKIFTKSDGTAIPDGTGQSLSSVLSITDNLSIQNLNVFIDISHNDRADLKVRLISPDNKEVILHNHTARIGQAKDIFAWYQPPYETIPDEGLAALDKFKDDNTRGDWILKVEDSNSYNTGTLNRWKLEVLEEEPPELDPIGDKVVNEGSLLEFTILAKEPNNQTLTYSATGLPQGAYFSPQSRIFSWLPNYNQQGVYTLHFEVSDGSLKDSEDVKITVNDVTITPISGGSVGVGLKVRVVQ